MPAFGDISFRPAAERRGSTSGQPVRNTSVDDQPINVVPATGLVLPAWQPPGSERPHVVVRTPRGHPDGIPYKEMHVEGPDGLPPLRLGIFSTRPEFKSRSDGSSFMSEAGDGWVYIPDEKFHIDPHDHEVGDTFGPQENGHHNHKVFISHAHSDHATDQSTATVVASPETHQMLDEFWSTGATEPKLKGSSRSVSPGVSYETKNGWFEFHHNGHMVGSLGMVYRPKIWANPDGTPGKGIWYTGDFNTRADQFRDGAMGEIPHNIHMVITEGTHFSPEESALGSNYDKVRADQMDHWKAHSGDERMKALGVPMIYGVHQLGKGQEEMKFWIENGIRPLVHPAIAYWARIYEKTLGSKSPFQSPQIDESGASVPGTGNYDVLDSSFLRPKNMRSWIEETYGVSYRDLSPQDKEAAEKNYSWQMEQQYAPKIEEKGNPRVVLMPQYLFDSKKHSAYWWMTGLGGPLLDRYNSSVIQSPAKYQSVRDMRPQSRTRHIISGRRPLAWWRDGYIPGETRRPDYSPIGRFPISGHASREDMQHFIYDMKQAGIRYGLALHANSKHPHYLSEYMTRQGILTNLVGFGSPPDQSGQRRFGYGLFW